MPWDQYGQAIGEDSSHPLIITPFGLCIVGEASGGSATSTGSILFSGGYDAYGARDGDKYWITI